MCEKAVQARKKYVILKYKSTGGLSAGRGQNMSVKIYCFTGTGNSLSIARQLAGPLRAEVERLDIARYGEEAVQTCVQEGDVLGFVFPVYAWSYPEAVKAFVKKLQIVGKPAYVFAVANCGDSAGETLAAFSRLLEKQGLRLNYGNLCVMPNNYLPLSDVDNKAMERTKLENARVRCAKITKDIEERLVGLNSMPPKAIDPFLLHVVHPLFGLYTKGAYRKFAAEESCTGCGVCEKVCPQRNIRLENRQPVWGKACAGCMACIHWCPLQAIQYGKKTRGFGRYQNPDVSVFMLCGEREEAGR